MRTARSVITISVLLLALLIVALFLIAPNKQIKTRTGGALIVYCAAGLKPPVSAIAEAYQKEYGVTVELQYGGSGTLLSTIKVGQQGDLFIAADTTYTDEARKQGLVAETMPVATLTPVIVTAKGNPKQITDLASLTREDVRLSIGLAEAASIGASTKVLLEKAGLWDRVQAAVQARGVSKPVVNEIATDVKIGTADAGIVWDSVAKQYPDLDVVPIAGAQDAQAHVAAAVLTASKQSAAALRFARYCSARDKGLAEFAKQGYAAVEGDVWAETPEITYFSGGVNRLAIEKTLAEFEQREGCRISTVYNGCGILMSQIKTGERPDVYHTCDVSFMKGVEDLFGPALKISETKIVIATAKGNPRNLHALADLAAPDLKVGVANEQQSTLGALTAKMLRELNIFDGVMKNVVSQTPTADLLVNQLRTGSLDAVVVYAVNMVRSKGELDVVPLDMPGALAQQTFAVGANSNHKQLVARLLDYLRAQESRKRYAECEFRWLAD